MCGHGVDDPFRRDGEVGQLAGRQPDGDGRLVAAVVQFHPELGAVEECAQQRLLALGDVIEPSSEPFAFELTITEGSIVDFSEIGYKDRPPFSAEHTVGEERCHGVEDDVFPYVDSCVP